MNTTSTKSTATKSTATIEAHPEVPAIVMTREFDAPVELLFRAHTDGDLVARWMGPDDQKMVIEEYDATTGGHWRWWSTGPDGQEHHFHGSFHEVRPHERIVQTFSYAGFPDAVALETGTFEDLGGGRSRLSWTSLCDSFATRDAMLESGMEVGVQEGYRKLDAVLAAEG